jgi:hypothetical protein
MNRRDFLKAVPAVAALGAVPGLARRAAGQATGAAGAAASPGAATASRAAVRLPVIQLVKPEADGGKSVLAALWERKTVRTMADKALPPQVLSNLLFAAFGVNRERGPSGRIGRTAASASNSQEIDVYVALAEGVYLYEAAGHRLVPLVEGDLRGKVGRGGSGARAPVRLIYVVDLAKYANGQPQEPGLKDAEIQKSYYFVDTGLIAGNVYLFAAAQGLAAWFHNCDKPGLAQVLGLRAEQRVLFAQTVGYGG